MVRGWLEPLLLILVCCHSAAWLSQEGTDLAQAVSHRFRPCDHNCVHCGFPNTVEFEQVVYRCEACSGSNCRLTDVLTARNWQSLPQPNWPDPAEGPADEPAHEPVVEVSLRPL